MHVTKNITNQFIGCHMLSQQGGRDAPSGVRAGEAGGT